MPHSHGATSKAMFPDNQQSMVTQAAVPAAEAVPLKCPDLMLVPWELPIHAHSTANTGTKCFVFSSRRLQP